MVRKSSGQDAQQPYTLVVLFKGRVYNIPVRFIPATQQYALGREKRGEEVLENLFVFFSPTNCVFLSVGSLVCRPPQIVGEKISSRSLSM